MCIFVCFMYLCLLIIKIFVYIYEYDEKSYKVGKRVGKVEF